MKQKSYFIFFLILILLIIFVIFSLFSYSVMYYKSGGQKLLHLRNIVKFMGEIPRPIINMVESKSLNPNKPPLLKKHKNKERFRKFIQNNRKGLLVVSRYDHSLARSVVDILDINNFELLHRYKHDVTDMNNQISNTDIFPNIKVNKAQSRFLYLNPLIMNDGSLISHGSHSVLFKLDFCSNLEWVNDDGKFHHSLNLDYENNLWIPFEGIKKSKFVNKYSLQRYADDAIAKVSINGKILYIKSIVEILIENGILPKNFAFNSFVSSKDVNPIHLNDIESAITDTKYWKHGDLFLSIRDQSAIVHYRPSTNKVINYITGPFAEQHDVDIISDKEISIFNNNNFLVNNKYSEILIYNFETKTFKKLFNDQLRKENFKTKTNGHHKVLKDGSLVVEETLHGRMILFNNKGEKEWEYVNKDKNGDIGRLFWFRVVEDELFIEKFKLLIKNKKCLN